MFVWIGVMIVRAPVAFGGYMQPWAADLLPVSMERAMLGTGALDIVIGLALLLGWKLWITALVASVHLLLILIVSGVTDITVRDIGLLGGTMALFVADAPMLRTWRQSPPSH